MPQYNINMKPETGLTILIFLASLTLTKQLLSLALLSQYLITLLVIFPYFYLVCQFLTLSELQIKRNANFDDYAYGQILKT